MENDLQPGVNVEENPLAKALEIQQKRVLDVLEMAVLQAMNDIRKAFDDLSDTDELFFETKLQEEILRIALGRHMILVDELSKLGDTGRAELAVKSIGKIHSEVANKHSPSKITTLGKS